MPKWLVYITLIIIVAAMIPPAVVAWMRTGTTERPPIHFIQDMDNQSKFPTQHVNPMFRDGRAMRPVVDGAVARGGLRTDDHFDDGIRDGAWATTYPPQTPLTMSLLERGRERYNIYCMPCHGAAGYGDGIVHQRAALLVSNPTIGNGTIWVQPKNIHEAEIRAQPPGQIYNTITHGIRNMAGYASQIQTEDRWAITAYVKALQLSQNADPASDLPEGVTYDSLQEIDRRPPSEENE